MVRTLTCGLMLIALMSVSRAQQAVPTGEEVYVDRLGCWNCHGKAGGGGAGAPIAKTRLPLRRFVSYIRLPSKEMPPFAPMLASDVELAIVYQWLDGIDGIKSPLPVAIDLKPDDGVRADGQTRADVEVAVTAAESASLRYRVTLMSNANAPVQGQGLQYQLSGRQDWSNVTTDEQGETLLQLGKAPARLRAGLPSGKTALIVEALDYTASSAPVIAGIGSAVLRVQ